MAGRSGNSSGLAPESEVPMRRKTLPTGIRIRHARGCDRSKCRCTTYEAFVYSKTDGRKIRKTFSALSEAKTWRQDAIVAVRRHELQAPSPTTVREAWDHWIAGAEAGVILTRGGDIYKPSALRGYRQSMENHVLPDLGSLRLGDVRRVHVQGFANRLLAQKLNASTIRNVLMPLRVLYRHAIRSEVVSVNPTVGLDLPTVRGRRERIAAPEEAAALLDALQPLDQAVWGDCLLRRTALRRVNGAAVGRRRSGGRRDPCGAILRPASSRIR
jgi:hypothetical protein